MCFIYLSEVLEPSNQNKSVYTSQTTEQPTVSGHSGSGQPAFTVSFIQQENNKLAKNTKRSYETQVCCPLLWKNLKKIKGFYYYTRN